MTLRFWAIIAVAILLPAFAATFRPAAPDASRETLAEIQELTAALDAYRARYGEYPPDFSDWNVVTAHVRRVLPDYQGPIPVGLTPPQALVFWLSGFAEGDDPFALTGRRTPLFSFDPARLVLQDDGEVYLPPGTKAGGLPYYYFDSRTYCPAGSRGAVGKSAVPYAAELGEQGIPARWVNGESFQIVAAGTDGRFGQSPGFKLFPGRTGWSPYDDDNLANFYDRTLGAATVIAGRH